MINLNDDSFNAVEGKAIFNNGQAGIVENVTLHRIEAKDPTGNQNAPDFKLFFKDSADAELSYGMYVIDPTRNEWAPKQLLSQQKMLKHLAHSVVSPDYQFPMYETPEAMLKGVLGVVRDSINHSIKFRIYTNYGNTMKSSNFLSFRSFPPCIEPMTVPLENTALKATTIEVLERPVADTVSGGTTSTVESEIDADW